jgi:hypothetical protein
LTIEEFENSTKCGLHCTFLSIMLVMADIQLEKGVIEVVNDDAEQ